MALAGPRGAWHGPCSGGDGRKERPIGIPAVSCLAVASGLGEPDLTRYVTVTLSLVLAIGGLAWGFRRLVGSAWKARASKRSLHVVDVLPLGGKRQLTVVRCYDRTFVLGLGERDVSLVAELDAAAAPAPAAPAANGVVPADPQDFERLLDAARARIDAATGGPRTKAASGRRDAFEEIVA